MTRSSSQGQKTSKKTRARSEIKEALNPQRSRRARSPNLYITNPNITRAPAEQPFAQAVLAFYLPWMDLRALSNLCRKEGGNDMETLQGLIKIVLTNDMETLGPLQGINRDINPMLKNQMGNERETMM